MIRLAILGTGGQAQRHAEEFQKIEGVELVACADIHLPIAQKFAKKNNKNTMILRMEESFTIISSLCKVFIKWSVCSALDLRFDDALFTFERQHDFLRLSNRFTSRVRFMDTFTMIFKGLGLR